MIKSLSQSYLSKLSLYTNKVVELSSGFLFKRQNSFKVGDLGKTEILMAEFCRLNKTYNFMVVLKKSIYLINIGEAKEKKKPKSITSGEINMVIFEYKSEKLCLNLKATPNEFIFYTIDKGFVSKQTPDCKIILGNLKIPEIGLSMLHAPAYQNIKEHLLEKVRLDLHFDFCYLYERIYLLHLDTVKGFLCLYDIATEGDKGKLSFKLLENTEMNYTIIDNLIIINYLKDSTSILIDIRKGKHNEIFGYPFAIEKQVKEGSTSYLTNQKTNPDAGGLVNVDIYKLTSVFFGDTALNVLENKVFNVKLNLKSIGNTTENHHKIFEFLLRREKGKIHAKNFLIKSFQIKISLSSFSKILNKVITNYKLFLIEQKELQSKFNFNLKINTLSNKENYFSLNELDDVILRRFTGIVKEDPDKYYIYFRDLLNVFQLLLIGLFNRK